MKKVKVAIDYPWCGISSDEYDFEVDDNATEDEIMEQAKLEVKAVETGDDE